MDSGTFQWPKLNLTLANVDHLKTGDEAVEEDQDQEDEEESVRIIHIESPWKIHVRSTKLEEDWKKLSESIARDGDEAEALSLDDVKKGLKVLAFVNGRWERAIVKSDVDCSNPKIKLIDVGNSLEISWKKLRQMSDALKNMLRSECFTEAVSLAGLEPRLGEDTWTEAITEALKQIISDGQVLTFKRQQGNRSMGDLFIERPSSGREDVGKSIKISVAELIIQMNRKSREAPRTTSPIASLSRKPEASLNIHREPTRLISKTWEDQIVKQSRLSNPTLSFRRPESQVFRARILHIDKMGVVWVIPNDKISLLSELTSHISDCKTPCPPERVLPGKIFLCRKGRIFVRGRILEVKESSVFYINIDSGEVSQCGLEGVYRPSTALLVTLPLAVPLKPYGVQRVRESGFSKDVIELIMQSVPRQQVTVTLLGTPDDSKFPLSAHIRYCHVSGDSNLQGNLASQLLRRGQAKLITTYEEFMKDFENSGLQWLQQQSDLSWPLSCPEHPFPLAEGDWLCVTVQAVCPLDESEAQTMRCSDANIVACHLIPLNSRLKFDQEQESIRCSSKFSESSLIAFQDAFEELKLKLTGDSSRALPVENVARGDNVLVNSVAEWCRATVIETTRDGVVQVSFTDYGHMGDFMGQGVLSLPEGRSLEPSHIRKFRFRMPDDDRELLSILSQLADHSEDTDTNKLLARVETISPCGETSDQLEEIYVTFWEAVERPSQGYQGFYDLRLIC